MDIALDGYYDIMVITRTTKYYMDNIWLFHQMGIMTLSSQLALGWEALHIVGTMGGGV